NPRTMADHTLATETGQRVLVHGQSAVRAARSQAEVRDRPPVRATSVETKTVPSAGILFTEGFMAIAFRIRLTGSGCRTQYDGKLHLNFELREACAPAVWDACGNWRIS